MTAVRGPYRTPNPWQPLPIRDPGDPVEVEVWRMRVRWTADARPCAACRRPLLPVTREQTRHPTCYPTDHDYERHVR